MYVSINLGLGSIRHIILVMFYNYLSWVPFEYVCNGNRECLDGSDECQNCNFDILADDQSLIASKPLQILVWIMGIISLIGNMVSSVL